MKPFTNFELLLCVVVMCLTWILILVMHAQRFWEPLDDTGGQSDDKPEKVAHRGVDTLK